MAAAAVLCPAQKRLVLIDQDGSGPGGSNQMAMLALLQAPQVEVLGITMVTGNAWRDEETLHTLRMLELTGHANVPVAKGAGSHHWGRPIPSPEKYTGKGPIYPSQLVLRGKKSLFAGEVAKAGPQGGYGIRLQRERLVYKVGIGLQRV